MLAKADFACVSNALAQVTALFLCVRRIVIGILVASVQMVIARKEALVPSITLLSGILQVALVFVGMVFANGIEVRLDFSKKLGYTKICFILDHLLCRPILFYFRDFSFYEG